VTLPTWSERWVQLAVGPTDEVDNLINVTYGGHGRPLIVVPEGHEQAKNIKIQAILQYELYEKKIRPDYDRPSSLRLDSYGVNDLFFGQIDKAVDKAIGRRIGRIDERADTHLRRIYKRLQTLFPYPPKKKKKKKKT
jgi:hypothetical protein